MKTIVRSPEHVATEQAAAGNGGQPVIAYFSMEIGLESDLPTYAGGLGVLAGDTLRAAADLGIPMVGVTLAHRKGYFRQRLDPAGIQTEEPAEWSPEERLEALDARVQLTLEGRTVHIRAWRYWVHGIGDGTVAVYLLDTALPENSPEDAAITDQLYGGDQRHRLRQEAVLGLGGVAILRALGHDVRVYHLNEGHSALLTLALMESLNEGALNQVATPSAQVTPENNGAGREGTASAEPRPAEAAAAPAAGTQAPSPDAATSQDGRTDSGTSQLPVAAVRAQCVFTTHTPVPAGHDRFPWPLVRTVLGDERAAVLAGAGCRIGDELNMTQLALLMSRYVNGVAMRHGEISRGMFPGYPIRAITNGVHPATWTSPPFRALFDRHLPGWQADPFSLRHALGIPTTEILEAHAAAKATLRAEVERRTGVKLAATAFSLGFARRATPYKRAALLFSDILRLKRIAREVGPLQIVYAGKAHPRDSAGKAVIKEVFQAAKALEPDVTVVYLEEYDMDLAARVIAGVDVWLNTPQKPHEASGTSGMKAALNGVPSLSVLDGWWIEGHIEGVTGWAIGEGWHLTDDDVVQDTLALYDKLERVILPLFYGRPEAFAQVMRSAIALNGSFFNTQRMLLQYAAGAYGRASDLVPGAASGVPMRAP
ncbi:MAG TPA: alpha-glucan family phosphorylase [Longimicrobiales bacterium]|nr:alpha-glucan family phosphorylase [Longimicrobiales bacterium]